MQTLQDTLGALILIALFMGFRPIVAGGAVAARDLAPAQTRSRPVR